jgi:general secretion pathway protein K
MNAAGSQRGVALVTAIIVVAIGTMIAVNLMWQGTLDLRRADAALAADQGLLYVQGAEAWAADILRQDLVDSPDSDHLGEQWAIELPPLPVDGGMIVGRLEDLQGRFNLNNLIGSDGRENELTRRQFERLLLGVEADPSLAGAVVDWLDSDTELRFPSGGEDVSYTDGDPPYRTANSTITSTSELMAVAGFDLDTYRALAPYVAVLPTGTKLNVNTASDVVLASLSDDIDIGMAGSLVEQRGDAEFLDINETFEGLVEADVLQELDGVSEHFLLTATVTLGSNQLTMRSVLQRDRSGITRAVFRSLGVE